MGAPDLELPFSGVHCREQLPSTNSAFTVRTVMRRTHLWRESSIHLLPRDVNTSKYSPPTYRKEKVIIGTGVSKSENTWVSVSDTWTLPTNSIAECQGEICPRKELDDVSIHSILKMNTFVEVMQNMLCPGALNHSQGKGALPFISLESQSRAKDLFDLISLPWHISFSFCLYLSNG